MLVEYLEKKIPNFDRIKELLQDSINCNHYSNNGPCKQKLELYLHSLFKLSHNKKILCLSSGTSALHLLINYYSYINKNPIKWLCPSFTFPSAVVSQDNVFLQDIDLNNGYTLKIPENDIEYGGIIITNLFGTNCNIFGWQEYCNKYGKILIFDNASSPLSRIANKNINEYGDASFGSLHVTKYLAGCGEGGFIVIDENKYDILSALSNFGFNNSRIYNKYGSNFKMSDMTAACHLSHIESYDIEKHLYIQDRFCEELNNSDTYELFNYESGIFYGNLPMKFSYMIDTKQFVDVGIMCHKYYLPLDQSHTNSWDLYNTIINFPLNHKLTEFQIDYIIKHIKRFK